MKLADAKRVRDEARSRSYHSIVPLGRGPDGYFARIYGPAPVVSRVLNDPREQRRFGRFLREAARVAKEAR